MLEYGNSSMMKDTPKIMFISYKTIQKFYKEPRWLIFIKHLV